MHRAAVTHAHATSPAPRPRIDLVDALRGSALLGILLLHSIEHWDFMSYPPNPPAWLAQLNHLTHDVGFFLFGGKAYGIFALLFGVSFCLILDGWSRRNIPFRGRFLWRLAVLAFFGYVHGLLYCGDILTIIAVLGVPLVFLYPLGNRALGWISVALMLQIPSLVQTANVLLHPALQPPNPMHWTIYGRLFPVFSNGSFLDVVRMNAWQGELAKTYWTIETARWLQMLGLFVWGVMLGRSGVLEDPVRSVRLAKRALVWGVVGFAILYPISRYLGDWGLVGNRRYVVSHLVSSYVNLAQLAVWGGAFVLLFRWDWPRAVLRLLAPYGRMSLTCYVTQAVIGVPLFYGFGLGWHRYLGIFHSVLIGAAIAVVQITLAHLWLRRFNYGPLEWLWRALTFLDFNVPMRRKAAAVPQPEPVTAAAS